MDNYDRNWNKSLSQPKCACQYPETSCKIRLKCRNRSGKIKYKTEYNNQSFKQRDESGNK